MEIIEPFRFCNQPAQSHAPGVKGLQFKTHLEEMK